MTEDDMHRVSRSPRRRLVLAGLLCLASLGPAIAQGTPPQPAAAQPTFPDPMPQVKPGSPVVDSLVESEPRQPLDVRKRPRHATLHQRHHARYAHRLPLERPALAGVELLQPLPAPGQPPHIGVPLPAYALDEVATALTMPPPPIVCHPQRREPGLPDPHLYREHVVSCEPDNP